MGNDISEPDWREFKQVRAKLLQHYCQRVLDEVTAITQQPGTAHERYLEVYQLIHTRDKNLARIFNDFRRSTALTQLILMRGEGLLSDDDLSRFSEKTQLLIRNFFGK